MEMVRSLRETARAPREVGEALGRWSNHSLAPDVAYPPLRPCMGLLWAKVDLVLLHEGRTCTLVDGDLAFIDRSRPIAISRQGRLWAGDMLDLSVPVRLGRLRRCAGRKIDGGDPLAGLVRRAWSIGLDMVATGMEDEWSIAHLQGMIGDLAGRLMANCQEIGLADHGALIIQRAEVLITSHMSDPEFSAGRLAALMGISCRHLSSLFASMGTTTTEAILTRRLTLARTMLADPSNAHASIATIACASGFEDASYFSRCFRKRHGETPRTYRTNHVN